MNVMPAPRPARPLVPRTSRRRAAGALAVVLGVLGTLLGLATPAHAATPVYVVAGDDPAVTGDQWGLHESYYSELRTAITDATAFGPTGTVDATFTIGTPRAIPLTAGALNGVDVYFLSARDIAPSEVPVLQAYVQGGGALVVNANAPFFFDTTNWLGFTLSPRVVYGDGPAPYNTTHRAPSPSTVVAAQAAHPVMAGPFGTVSAFENWHSVAGFTTAPTTATVLARTTLTGPDDNGSATNVTITSVGTLATIPAGALGAGAGPVLATSDVDTFSNAYTTALGFPVTDALCTLTGTSNGKLARNAFAWIAAQKATITPAATLTRSAASVAAGGTLTATWTGITAPSATDWIGLYASSTTADTAYLAWRYTTGTASGSATFTIPTTAPAGTTYELRLFAKDGFTRLAKTTAFAVTTTAPTAPTLTRSVASVAAGSTLTATWTGITGATATDWIGLYTSSTTADSAYLAWRYTTGTASGSATFTIPTTAPAGTTYELRLFANDGYTRLAKTTAFAVTTTAPTAPTLTTTATTVDAGSSITLSWNGITSTTATDWIGLYASSTTADSAYLAWRYTTGTANGSATFTIPTTTPAGTTYELRLFANDGFTRLAKTTAFTVTGPAAPTLTVSPASVARGASVTATWSGITTPSATDWIGLYATSASGDTTYLAWRYTTGTANGSATFTIPTTVAPGTTYELRLFANDGFTRLAKTTALTIT